MRFIFLSSFALLFFAAPAGADPDLNRVESPHSVNETMERLFSVVAERGMTIMARINHGAGARNIDLSLPESQLLIFGNPRLGTALMQEAPEMGLDLPIRMLVLEGSDGTTRIIWRSPAALFDAWGLPSDMPQLAAMTGVLAAIAAEAVVP